MEEEKRNLQKTQQNLNQEIQGMIQHFQTTLRQNNISNWTYDITRHVIILNPYTYYAFERTEKNEILNIPESQIAAGLCHPNDIEILRRLYRRLDQGEKHVEENLRFLDSRLKIFRWKKCVYTVIENQDGSTSLAVGSAADITEQMEVKKKYEAAVEYRKRTQTDNLLFSGHCSITENRIFEMSDFSGVHLIRKFGSSRDEFFRGLESLILDQAKKKEFHSMFMNESAARNFELGISKSEISCEISLDEKKKKRVWVMIHLEVAKAPETNDIEGFITAFDVTEAHMQEQMIKTVVELDYDYAMIVDIEKGTYRLNSASTVRSMAATPVKGDYDKEIQKYARKFARPEDYKIAYDEMRIPFVQEQLKTQPVYSFKVRLINEDGSILHKRMKFSYLDKEHTQILVTRVDITDIIESEEKKREELTQALKLTEQAAQAKTSFLARMSHDIRTPMNTIIGMSALARDEIHNPEAIDDYLHKIDTAGKFLLGLVNDCLDLEKIENNRMTLKEERYSYQDFLNAIRTMFIPLCEAKHINLIIKDSGIAVDIIADRVRFEQIFFNLLSNSVKYTPEKGTIVFRTLHSVIHENIISCDFEVRDNGIGMSREFQRKMFEPFEQESNEIVTQSQGSGLGLSIVKNIVEMMGGTIEIYSEEGKGTSTVIHLDLKMAGDELQPKEHMEQADAFGNLQGKRILLFEDHPLNTEIATKLLQKKGMIVKCAENGKEGLEIFRTAEEYYFDAILMDIRMPVMDGYETTRCIRALPRADVQTIPIIAMTANAYEDDVRKCLTAGMDTHLSKPIDPQLLYRTLAKFLKKA
ncbi:MAG: ATP-binding protein [Hespellia sp.]|nr:ATP-binding protein [Hespellia sp.]